MVPLPSAAIIPFESAAKAKAELSTFKTTTFTRLHTDTITSLAWNSTGTRLASGSRDGTIRIWNPERADPRNTPDLKLPRGKAGVVRKIVWDPVQRKGEAERLATLNSDASVRIWDTKTKTVVAEVRCKTSHDPVLIGLAWSADGKFICAVSRDDYITLIDAQTFTVLTSTRGPYGASYASFHPTHPLLAVTAVQATQLHPYGKLSFYTYLPSSSSDPSSIVLKEAIQLNAHVGSCSPPHFSPIVPHNLLLGGADSLISLYSTHEFYPIRTFDYNKGTGLAGGVKETGWTWCGGFVTRLGDDGVVWVGDCETGEEVWSSTSTGGGGQLGLKLSGSETLAWSPRGYVLALTVEGGRRLRGGDVMYWVILVIQDDQLPSTGYWSVEIPLARFLEGAVLDELIKNGSLLALSDTQIDSQDTFCIADGVLRMALTKETYEKAGLEGHVSKFGKKRRWNVTADLKASSMVAGKKGFERLRWSFTETLLSVPVRFTFALANPTPESIALLTTHLCPGTALTTVEPIIRNPPQALAVPSFTPPEGCTLGDDYWKEWALELHEWIALAQLGSGRLWDAGTGRIDPYYSTYAPPPPNPSSPLTPLTHISYMGGLIPTTVITEIFDLLWANANDAQWWSLNVQGSEDAPISWDGRDHGRDKAGSGENGYTILRMGSREEVVDEEGLMWEVVGGEDEYS
ncbi:hypothetical protein YB2330_006038 [Saitoella coloradoensis]